MWGSIITEANTLTNFNFGFSTYKSDILVHLSQWQYWWWFWFSLFWTLYFFIIIRVLSKRTFSFNPTLNTSIRGHGKWGDFLVALIPLSWCGNILVNSNFILRMIEWQNESSLFTIRVQGKQWYWVYKYDASAAQSIFTAPKNIGRGRWVVTGKQATYTANSYYEALSLGTQLEFKGLYYKYLLNDSLDSKSLNQSSFHSVGEGLEFKKDKSLSTKGLSVVEMELWKKIKEVYINRIYWRSKMCIRHINAWNKAYEEIETYYTVWNEEDGEDNYIVIWRYKERMNFKYFKKYRFIHRDDTVTKKQELYPLNTKNITNTSTFYDYSQVDDLSNFAANVAQQNAPKPLTILTTPLNLWAIENSSVYIVLWKCFKGGEKLAYRRAFSYQMNQIYKKIDLKREIRSKIGVRELLRQLNIKNTKVTPTREEAHFIKKYKREKYIAFSRAFRRYTGYGWWSSLYEERLKIDNVRIYDSFVLYSVIFDDNNTIVDKVEDSELFWGFRQKKYKRLQKFVFKDKVKYNRKTLEPEKKENTVARVLKNTLITSPKKINPNTITNYHNSIKYNRHRSELVPVNLARRLLRTKRTLVLPAHVNITLISSSYDVVHSWFIPGLGLKIDCVPGRSTHHSFYIDNVGFYYGQCAEICGRYHHHMPIRLCALSFDHFLVWWHKKGLRRLHRLSLLSKPSVKKKEFLNPISGIVTK